MFYYMARPVTIHATKVQVLRSARQLCFTFADEHGSGGFDALLERAHQILALQPGGDGRQKLQDDPSAFFQESRGSRPEESRVQRYRYAGDVKPLIQCGDARLVVGWRAGFF